MNKEQILTKAIEKAIANGWDGEMALRFKLPKDDYSAWDGFDEDGWYRSGKYDEQDERLSIFEVIFNHDFAKRFFGEQMVYTVGEGEPLGEGYHALLHPIIPRWKFHLQQMVIADDPIEYLGRYI